MPTPKVPRAIFLKRGFDLMGSPYIYGGRSRQGMDCSGFPGVALHLGGGPDLRQWWTSRFWTQLAPIDSPLPGDVALYGGKADDDVEHLMVLLLPEGTPGVPLGMVMGACGGDKTTTTLLEAMSRGACVTTRIGINYRPASDFRGFRSMSSFLF